MEGHIATQPLTPALSPEYRGEGVRGSAANLAAADRQDLPLALHARQVLHSLSHFSSCRRSAAADVTYANRDGCQVPHLNCQQRVRNGNCKTMVPRQKDN